MSTPPLPNREPPPPPSIQVDIPENCWKPIGQITLHDGRIFSIEVCGLKKNEQSFSPIENFNLTSDQSSRCHEIFHMLGQNAQIAPSLFKDRTTYLSQNTIFDKGEGSQATNPVLTASIEGLQERVDALSHIIFPGSAKIPPRGVFRSTLDRQVPEPDPAAPEPNPAAPPPAKKSWWRRLLGMKE